MPRPAISGQQAGKFLSHFSRLKARSGHSHADPGRIIVFHLSHRRTCVREVSLEISAGERVAIIGQNGAGKTTLVKHFIGLLKPAAGRVMIWDWDTSLYTPARLATRVGYVFQNPDDQLFDELTKKYSSIKTIILYGSKARGDFLEGSDIDLLFIADSNIPRSIKAEMGDIIYNYELANDIVVSAIFVSESEFKNKVSLFLMKVRKEGIALWSRE